MRLASKVLNRLRREVKHVAAYTRARVFATEPGIQDLLRAWNTKGRPRALADCLHTWVEGRPHLFTADLGRPEDVEALRREAERVLGGAITVFGKPVSIRPVEMWRKDPQTRHSWPLDVHFTRLKVFHPVRDGVTDIRRLWEVGRFGWALPLAQAYALDRRVEHAMAWSDYAGNFIGANQPEFGPHWLNAMEVSIRSIQWCRALGVFLQADLPGRDGWKTLLPVLNLILPSLLAHGRYIRSHLEWTPYGRTNHYLSNLVGLLALSVFVPQFRQATEWRSFARLKLVQEIKIQTDADGFHSEASTAYHRFAVELYALVLAMDREHRLAFPPSFHKKVREMLAVDLSIRGRDDLDPRIGDDDSGTIFPQIAPVAGSRKILVELIASAAPPVKTGSLRLRHSGIHILRSGVLSCHVACGPNGQQGVGGHAHNDKLSVVLMVHGRPVVVDSGTCCYSADIQLRDRFRSTAMHNTITVDGREQNPLEDWRKLADRARAKCLAWHDSADETFFLGSHSGYRNLKRTHRRTVQLEKRAHKLLILDEMQGSGSHTLDFYLHLAPWITREQVRWQGGCLSLPLAECRFEEGVEPEILNTVMSPVYGQQAPNLTLHLRWKTTGPWRFAWEFRARQATSPGWA